MDRERKAERDLERLQSLISSSPIVLYTAEASGQYATTFVSANVRTQLGYGPEEFIKDPGFWAKHIHPDDAPRVLTELPSLPDQGQQTHEYRFRAKDGTYHLMHDERRLASDGSANPAEIVGYWIDLTESKRAEEQIHQNAARAEALSRFAARLNAQPDLDAVVNAVCEETARALNVPATSVFLYDDQREVYYLAADFGLPAKFRQHHLPISRAAFEEIARRHGTSTGQLGSVSDKPAFSDLPNADLYTQLNIRPTLGVPMYRNGQLLGGLNVYGLGQVRNLAEDELALLQALSDQAAQAITNARLFEAELTRREELGALYDLSRALAGTDDSKTISELVVRCAVETIHVTFARITLIEGDEFVLRAAHPIRILERDFEVGSREPIITHPYCQRVLQQNTLVILGAATSEMDDHEHETDLLGLAQTICLVPLRAGEQALGVLILGEARREEREPFTPDKIRLARSIGDQAASALHRAALREETQRRLDQVQALHAIDTAITGSLDLQMTLNIFLEQLRAQLHADAAAILLLNPYTQTLEYAAGRGFRSKQIQHSRVYLGEGHAGRAALQRHTVSIRRLPEAGDAFTRTQLLLREDFISYYGVPLIAKGQVKGVLDIFFRAQHDPDSDWLEFLQTLATQAAIAIDNAWLFNDLQRSNVELTLAYDATIEGWARALDLRDKGTNGHTQRVTEITLKLARTMGFSDAELVPVRRGALLHDLGKMGVPDSILLKLGPLTEEERKIMELHPQYAYEMLSRIAYLRPALDIPYCHHEKWDGTGYPRGLNGEHIPLAARIFAVVDVWDALCTDRPYRVAWPEAKVREHIRSLSGAHFDPQIVTAFLKMGEQ